MRYQEKDSSVRILIVNDDNLTRKSLYEMLCRAGYVADITNSVKGALEYLVENIYSIVFVDVSESSGLELIKTIKQKAYPSEVIVLTSYANIEAAVNSIKMGAFEYLVRPVEDARIISTIERALASNLATQTKPIPITGLTAKDGTYYGLVGGSPLMNDIYSLIERVASSAATILLRGESGTGKRMIARAIHMADKRRKNKPFVEIACGALPRDIIESELFGHMKGAFTGAINDHKGRFELAHGGTILLDDIDSFPPDIQVKLLRVLQEREFERVGDHRTVKVDVRIIVSTNQDLEKAVSEKKFREDLYYRLNVISINVPPLRRRKGDLLLLAEYFVKLYARENRKAIDGISPDILNVLKDYHWPGNIRELQNIVERAVILDTDDIIGKDDLPEIILNGAAYFNSEPGADKIETPSPSSLKDAMQEPEKVYILQVLKEAGWNKKKAAMKMGVNRTTLYNKLKKYDLISSLEGKKD